MKAVLALVLLMLAAPVVNAEEPVADGKFWTVAAITVGTTVMDIESTFKVLGECASCFEGNRIWRPFVERGRGPTYAVHAGISAGALFWAYKLKKEGHRLWWVVPIAVSATHSFAGVHNFRLSYTASF